MLEIKQLTHSLILGLSLLLGLACTVIAGQPLSSEQLIQLHELGINVDAIVQKINLDGIGFSTDKATLAALEQHGVPAEVIAATQKQSSVPTLDNPLITYANVKQLVELGISEPAIIERLRSSPTLFTLDTTQEQELRTLGVSDQLFQALQGERPAAPATPGEKVTDVAVILDCSGSMKELSSDGQSKIDVAKQVVGNMIQKFPEGLRFTFIVYGGSDGSCNSVRVVRPLSSLDQGVKSLLDSEIHHLQPKGKTPIALALRTAGRELAKYDAVSSVVLISDGKETCHGDPAGEAAALAQRFNLRYGVTVFGFDVAGEERASLEAIAEAGQGEYFHAGTAQELIQQTAAAQEKIEVEPVIVTTRGRRAVVVLSPRIEFPAMKQIALIEANRPLLGNHNYKSVMESEVYDRPIRIPSGKKKYDLGFLPAEGQAVRLAPGIQIPDRSTIQIRPEDYLGLVNLGGEGLPPVKIVALVRPGKAGPGHNFNPVQTSDRYGTDLLVPAGKYDLWILNQDGKRELLEEDLEVTAGERLQLD
ncbi:MAG: VWA domain-containing protein [Pirellulales bacterium]